MAYLLKELAFVFGDPQLDSAPNYDRPNPETGRSTRFDETVEMVVAAAREAWDRGCRVMVFLGDASENKDPVSVEMRALAFIFSEWIRWGGVVKAIPGNHDGNEYEVTSSSIEPLAMMRSTSEFTLHQKITWDPDTNSIFVPYVHRASPADIGAEMFLEMPESVSGPVTAFTHYGFEGAKAGPYERIVPGDYLSPAQFEKIIGLDLGYGGHIHRHGEGVFTFSDGRVMRWGHPGSTTIHGIDERNDVKGYYTHNFGTRERIYYPIKQSRRFISIPFPDVQAAIAITVLAKETKSELPTTPWSESDLVRVDGVSPRGVDADSILATAMKEGILPRPFFLRNEVTGAAEARVARDSEVTREGGIRQALVTMVRNKYPSDKDGEEGIMAEATEAALAVMREQGSGVSCSEIWPESLEIEGFRTFKKFKYEFQQGVAVLITGESGVGKSNFSDALFVNATGESFKNPAMASTVPRDAGEGKTVEIYGGVSPLGRERFRITRAIKVAKSGSASQKLTLERWNENPQDGSGVTGFWDGGKLNDGGVVDVQARIDSLFGGSAIGQRTTNFGIQGDKKNLLFSRQDARKAVMLDAIGLSVLTACSRVLEKRRLEASQEAKGAESMVQGMKVASAGSEERLRVLEEEIRVSLDVVAETQAKVPDLESSVSGFEASQARERERSQEAQERLRALPNTEAGVAVAVNAKDAREKGFARLRIERAEEYRRIQGEEKRVQEEIQDVGEIQDVEPVRARVLQYATEESEAQAKVEERREEAATAKAVVTSLLRDLEENVRERGTYSGKDIGTCSKCRQAIDSTKIEEALARLDAEKVELNGEIEKARAVSLEAEAKLKTASAAVAAANQGWRTAKDMVHGLELKGQKLAAASAKLGEVQERLRKCAEIGTREKGEYEADLLVLAAEVETKTSENETNKAQATAIRGEIETIAGFIETVSRDLMKANLDLQAAKSTISSHEKRVQGNRDQVQVIEGKRQALAVAESALPATLRRARVAEIAASLLDAKSGLPLYLIDEALPAFEERINTYLFQLGTDRLQVKVQSPPDSPDDLDILVDNGRPGRLLDVLDYSGGQQRRIEIACKFAMADIKRRFRNITFGLAFWDEPTDGLSSFGKKAFLRILFDRLTTYPVTVVTSHDAEIIREFSNRLHFESGADGETVLQGAA